MDEEELYVAMDPTSIITPVSTITQPPNGIPVSVPNLECNNTHANLSTMDIPIRTATFNPIEPNINKPLDDTFQVTDHNSPTLAGEIYYTVDGLNFTKVPAEMGDRFQLTPMGLTRIFNAAEPPSQQIIIKGNFNFQLLSYDK
jgi:hypothetical protein